MNPKTRAANVAVGYYLSYLLYGNDKFLREAKEWAVLATLVTQPYTLMFPQSSGYEYVSQ
jgi:hypothetical protein